MYEVDVEMAEETIEKKKVMEESYGCVGQDGQKP